MVDAPRWVGAPARDRAQEAADRDAGNGRGPRSDVGNAECHARRDLPETTVAARPHRRGPPADGSAMEVWGAGHRPVMGDLAWPRAPPTAAVDVHPATIAGAPFFPLPSGPSASCNPPASS